MTLPLPFVAKPPPLSVDDDGVLRVGGTRVRFETIINAFLAGCKVIQFSTRQLTNSLLSGIKHFDPREGLPARLTVTRAKML